MNFALSPQVAELFLFPQIFFGHEGTLVELCLLYNSGFLDF
jgi:hypothetical protein